MCKPNELFKNKFDNKVIKNPCVFPAYCTSKCKTTLFSPQEKFLSVHTFITAQSTILELRNILLLTLNSHLLNLK